MASEEFIERVYCPKCGEQLQFEVMSKLLDTSRVSMTLTPHPGEFLSAKHVGGSITDMCDLLASVEKDAGVKTVVVVEGITSEAGAVKIDFILTRTDAAVKKREPA